MKTCVPVEGAAPCAPTAFNWHGLILMSVDIPNYRIVEKLGEGAQTRIFRARCMRTGRDYAVKIVKVVRPEDMSFVELLRAEHAIGTSIDHPVIRKLYELRILRQRLRTRGAILFMEYVNGISMADREFRFTLDSLLGLLKQVAQGLHAMHVAGYVHADLKPNNIMVTADLTVKLIDLGQSSRIREAKPRIQGTIDYMAPEQAQRGMLDQRTDVFGLGAALHRVVTGKPVPTEMNQTVSMHSQSLVGKRRDEIQRPSMEELPLSVSRLIADCCKPNPADRIADMPALIERIDLARTVMSRQGIVDPTAAMFETDENDQDGEPDLSDVISADLGTIIEDDFDFGAPNAAS